MRMVSNRWTESVAGKFLATVSVCLWLFGQVLCLEHCQRAAWSAKLGSSCCAKKVDHSPTSSQNEGERHQAGCGSLQVAEVQVRSGNFDLVVSIQVTLLSDSFVSGQTIAVTVALEQSTVLIPVSRVLQRAFPEEAIGALSLPLGPPSLA